MSATRLGYTDSALPGNAETVTLFDSTTPNRFSLNFQHKFRFTIGHSHAGSVRLFRSFDEGDTWVLVEATALTGAAVTSGDFVIETYGAIKVEMLNGATPQTTFDVSLSLVEDRAAV